MRWDIVKEDVLFHDNDVVRFVRTSGAAEPGNLGMVVGRAINQDGQDDDFLVFVPKRMDSVGNIIIVVQARPEDIELSDLALAWYELLEVQ